MEKITFKVQGSAPEPYQVTFIRRPNSRLSTSCNCKAGERQQHCKHRIRIMSGEQAHIVSSNAENVRIIQDWLPGTDLETALQKYIELEKESERIKKELKAAKENLAKVMHT